MVTCKNCGTQTNDIYCSHCGQKAVPERITFHSLTHEIVHFFTHAEKGFFYTTRSLVVSPEQTIVDFIDGKRKKYQKPVSYYLIWIAIYSLVLYSLEKFFGENKVVSFEEYFGPGETTKFAISHLNVVLTLLVPVQAVYLYFFLMGNRYNYFEALVAMLYGIGTVIFFQTIFVMLTLFYYLFTGNTVSILWSDVCKILYFSWMLTQLVKALNVKWKFLKVAVLMVLLFGTFTAWRLYITRICEIIFLKSKSKNNRQS